MNRRMLYIPILHIDTNLINAYQKLSAVNQLEKWYDDGVILINISSTAFREAQADGNAQRLSKANEQIFTYAYQIESQNALYKKIETALFPRGTQNDNQQNDVKIVCEASRYQAILVTSDGASKSQPGGILGNRHKLKDVVKILSPNETVIFVKQKIRERDDFNKKLIAKFGGTLPHWTGQD